MHCFEVVVTGCVERKRGWERRGEKIEVKECSEGRKEERSRKGREAINRPKTRLVDVSQVATNSNYNNLARGCTHPSYCLSQHISARSACLVLWRQ